MVADLKKSLTKQIKSGMNEKEEATRQIIDCTPITHSVPLVYYYLVPCSIGNSCETVRIDGNDVRVSDSSFVVYLKDARPSFTVTLQDLLTTGKYVISRPQVVVSGQEKSNMSRHLLRDARRKETIGLEARKEDETLARDNWIELEFEKMKQNIKKDAYTYQDFKTLLKQVNLPFKHCSSDGYITQCNHNETMCINKMALVTIDGVLGQKRQAEEMLCIKALEKM